MKLSALMMATGVVALAAAAPAQAHLIQYTADLTGGAEIPANASPGTGTALITVDFDTLMMTVEANFTGLLGNTTASHIHCCTAVPGASNVGVATMTPSFAGFPLGVTSGTYMNVFDMSLATSYNASFITAQGGIANAFNALVAGMASGNAYFNIHSSMFPGGEIRGLLHEVPVAAVPEPQSVALIGLGLAAMGLVTRRRIKA
jgi:hypothetical protein